MATADVEEAIYLRIWALLVADSAFATLFPVGRRVHYAAVDPWPLKPGLKVAPADFPEVEVDYAGNANAIFTDDEHYGDYDPQADEAWVESADHEFVITIRCADTRITGGNTAVAMVRRILRAAGPTLGLPYVSRWGRMTRRDTVVGARERDGRGTRRRVVRLTIPVHVDQDGSA